MASSVYPNLQSLFDSDKLSDATIRCGNRSFKVHAAILTAASSYFEKAFAGTFEEASTKVIHLQDDDEDAVLGMLRFIYNHSYNDCQRKCMYKACRKACTYPEALFDAQMYVLGDKYDLPDLKAKSSEAFSESILHSDFSAMLVDDVKGILDLAYHRLPDSDRSLRESLLKAVLARGNDFWIIDGHDKSADLLAQYPQFATEVVRRYVRREEFLGKRQADQYTCPNPECTQEFRMDIAMEEYQIDYYFYCPHCFQGLPVERWLQVRIDEVDENVDIGHGVL